jgi:D-glycero-alpha-D-manno-heptose-7-phosphate kinase
LIIVRAPYRISFFGGGSDYPDWFNNGNKGEVISSTINKYIYITCRELPNFFRHNYRIVYSKIENVKKINDIKHNAVKSLLTHFDIKKGLEIHYDGDLPSRSGMGSSSSFVVGLTHALKYMNAEKINKKILASESINFERNLMKENVGWQDQIACSYGGFNNIVFQNNSFKVKPINCSKKFILNLNQNLYLMYTGINRTAQKIANSYTDKLNSNKKRNIKRMLEIANDAKKIIRSGNADDFGSLLHETWMEKKYLSNSISNRKIDEIYTNGIKNGANGGKLLGAGGGGFILFYVKKEKKDKFLHYFKNKPIMHIKLNNNGSKIIYSDVKI